MLILLGVVLVVFAVLFVTLRKRIGAMFYIFGAGVLFGFVATLAKVVIDRIKTLLTITDMPSNGEWLLIGCIVAASSRRCSAATSCRPRTPPGRPTSWSRASR